MPLNLDPVGTKDFIERLETGPPKSLPLAFPQRRQSSAVHVSLSSMFNLSKSPNPGIIPSSVEPELHVFLLSN